MDFGQSTESKRVHTDSLFGGVWVNAFFVAHHPNENIKTLEVVTRKNPTQTS